jgi:hypothetical protein
MKNVIAFSLWGNLPMYWVGAKKNIELASKYFPGWICRFYIDSNCSQELIDTLRCDNVEILLVNSQDSFHGMFWRFWAADDPEVNIMLSRDCDSRLSQREVIALNEWLSSDKDFHIMRDHPYHCVSVLGGMWGCRNGIIRELNITKLIENWNQYSRKGIDQDFLGQVVYPKIKDRAFEHSEFGIKFGNPVYKFPMDRNNKEFVGDVFDENDIRHPEFWKQIK